jgi:hypothetical protein
MKIVIGDSNHRGFWGFVAQTIVLTLAVIIAAKLMPGVSMNNVWTALLTGLVIALLNRFLRPPCTNLHFLSKSVVVHCIDKIFFKSRFFFCSFSPFIFRLLLF